MKMPPNREHTHKISKTTNRPKPSQRTRRKKPSYIYLTILAAIAFTILWLFSELPIEQYKPVPGSNPSYEAVFSVMSFMVNYAFIVFPILAILTVVGFVIVLSMSDPK